MIVIKLEVTAQALPSNCDRFIVFEIHLFILDGSPQSLDKDVIKNPSSSIMTDGNPLSLQTRGKVSTGILASLVGVENLGLSPTQRLFEGLQAKVNI
jgi:hypothetical protein